MDHLKKEVGCTEVGGKIDDPSVFPLAIPLITGPGAIATVILISGSKPGLAWIISTGIISTLVLLAVFYFSLRQME